MTRVLVLCTHNSARSQMAEGWIRQLARERGVALEVHSAGTERTFVKPDAIAVMTEVGVDLSGHASTRLDDLLEGLTFDVVLTVCDDANEACPVYPARTTRLHVALPDPSGGPRDGWRLVRDAVRAMSAALVDAIAFGRPPTDEALREAAAAVLGRVPQATTLPAAAARGDGT